MYLSIYFDLQEHIHKTLNVFGEKFGQKYQNLRLELIIFLDICLNIFLNTFLIWICTFLDRDILQYYWRDISSRI